MRLLAICQCAGGFLDPVPEPETGPSIVVVVVVALGVLVKPCRAITRPGGTVMRPNLKQHTETATVCTIDPSGSAVAVADETRAAATAQRSFDGPGVDDSGGVAMEGRGESDVDMASAGVKREAWKKASGRGGVGICSLLIAFCGIFFPLLGLETNFDRT